ncbi:sigma-54-dependent transcriptional regulator [Azospirillum sp. sgz302134]
MSEPCDVLVVDDEQPVRLALVQWLGLAGLRTVALEDASAALDRLDTDFPGILVTDIRMPRMDGLTLMRHALERDPDLPVVLVTGHGDIAMAVDAMRQGAYDFIEKPFVPDRLVDTLRRACEKRRLVLENRRLRRQVTADSGIEARLLGTSAVMDALRRQVLDLSGTSVNVIIHGETGTGKELVARCLHDLGPRAGHPFVAVNCGAIPESMFESEFFGHEAGAFTGAVGRRAGKFEHAHRGTLFLDEIESMPMALQVKVLRTLQERTVEPLGSNRSIPVDVRTVAATKVDLLEAVRAGRFREDLYYRLSVADIRIPALRDRAEDIPLLFEHFVAEAARVHNRTPRAPTADDRAALVAHGWQGNVRELRNAAERFALSLGDGALSPGPGSGGGSPSPADLRPLAELVADFESRKIRAAFAACDGDVGRVMERLDIPRRTLNEKMQRYGIDRQAFLPAGRKGV